MASIKKVFKKASIFSNENKDEEDKFKKDFSNLESSIRIKAIIEVLGKPKDYVEESIKSFVENIGKHRDLNMLDSSIEEAKELDNGAFNTFAEVEIEARNVAAIFSFCYDYMPSSIEVIEPESLKIPSPDLTNWLNDLQGRLHRVDMLVKKLSAENEVLRKNSNLILRNNILLSLKDKSKSADVISHNIGIVKEKTIQFLEALVKQGFLKNEGAKYAINPDKVSFSDDI